MIEFVNLVLQLLAKMVQAAPEVRKKRKLRNIGVFLFRIYYLLNEIVFSATHIVRRLERYVEITAPGHPDDPYWIEEIEKDLSDELRVQRHNLLSIANILRSNALYVLVVDADIAGKVSGLLELKLGFVQHLANLVDPLVPENKRLQDHYIFSGAAMIQLSPYLPAELEATYDDSLSPRQRARARVMTYLEHSKPLDRIAELDEQRKALRLALTEAFTIQELLLVADDIDRTSSGGS